MYQAPNMHASIVAYYVPPNNTIYISTVACYQLLRTSEDPQSAENIKLNEPPLNSIKGRKFITVAGNQSIQY